MAKDEKKLEVRKEDAKMPAPTETPGFWRPFEDLHREMDRLFEELGRGTWLRPFRMAGRDLEPGLAREFMWRSPMVDLAEKDEAYEISAELPGLDSKDIDVATRNGTIVIRGEKQAETEDKAKDYYLKERQFGSFERIFRLPDDVDSAKIEARFKNGVLTVTLPKTEEARKPAKKVEVKAA